MSLSGQHQSVNTIAKYDIVPPQIHGPYLSHIDGRRAARLLFSYIVLDFQAVRVVKFELTSRVVKSPTNARMASYFDYTLP